MSTLSGRDLKAGHPNCRVCQSVLTHTGPFRSPSPPAAQLTWKRKKAASGEGQAKKVIRGLNIGILMKNIRVMVIQQAI